MEAPGLEKGVRKPSLEVSGGRDGSCRLEWGSEAGAQGDLVAVQDGGGGDLGSGGCRSSWGEQQEWGGGRGLKESRGPGKEVGLRGVPGRGLTGSSKLSFLRCRRF